MTVYKNIFTIFLLFFAFQLTAQDHYSIIEDENKNKDTLSETENTGGDESIDTTSIDLSIYNDTLVQFFPDEDIFYFWDTFSIHDKRYDFARVMDTVELVLADTSSVYTHPYKGRVTSKFGRRGWRYHNGTDVDLTTGDSVWAAFDGIVRISHYSRSYGHVVVIRHSNGLETLYAHLSKRFVEPNQAITSGTCLGLGGNTGRSYGSHLHFEVRYFDVPINPEDIIDFSNFNLIEDTIQLSKYHFRYMDEVYELQKIRFHRVRSGESLSVIARKYGTSVGALCRMNGISRNSIIRVGQRLRVR